MKNSNPMLNRMEYVDVGKKRYNFHFSFTKKDNIIKNIEIVVACIVAFIAGMGIYELLQ